MVFIPQDAYKMVIILSPSFTVSNRVKQGGIISPILFNVYMGELSVLLNSSGIRNECVQYLLNVIFLRDFLQI